MNLWGSNLKTYIHVIVRPDVEKGVGVHVLHDLVDHIGLVQVEQVFQRAVEAAGEDLSHDKKFLAIPDWLLVALSQHRDERRLLGGVVAVVYTGIVYIFLGPVGMACVA